MFLKKERLEFYIIGVILVSGLLFLVWKNYIVKNSQVIATVTLPTVVTPIETTNNSEMESSDGRSVLTMKQISNKNSVTYSFYTDNKLLFTKTENTGGTMSVPFNTWSPSNKYSFVDEKLNGQTNYYVLPQVVNVTDLFNEKLPNYVLTDITGWADPVLLILNTNTKDGAIGPSFWFNVIDHSFTLLSSRFN